MHGKPIRRNGLRFTFVTLACLSSVTVLVGCGGDANLGDVTGVVTLDGKPLPDAFVTFTPQEAGPDSNGTATFGRTAADGSYRMYFTDDKMGSTLGPNSVSIETWDVSSDGPGTKEIVPNVYNSKTTLVADVKSGKNSFNFDLKSDASKVEQTRDDN